MGTDIGARRWAPSVSGDGPPPQHANDARSAKKKLADGSPRAGEPERMKREIDRLLLKIEALALLGDLLSDQFDRTSKLRRERAGADHGSEALDAALRQGEADLNCALERIADRSKAVDKALANARRIIEIRKEDSRHKEFGEEAIRRER